MNISQKDVIRYMLSLLNSLQYIMFNQRIQTNNFKNVLNQFKNLIFATGRFSQDEIDKAFQIDLTKLIARGIIHKIMDNLTEVYNHN